MRVGMQGQKCYNGYVFIEPLLFPISFSFHRPKAKDYRNLCHHEHQHLRIQFDPILATLRERALRLDEPASNQLFLRYFIRHIFTEPNWIHGTEVAPVDHHDRTRFDIAIQELSPDPMTHGPTALLFRLTGQGKKGKAGPKDILTAECQAYSLAWAYMHGMKGKISSVWSITYFGPYARLWVCQYSGPGWLEPFYPLKDGDGERETYRDIKTYEEEFKWAFDYIKATSQPNPELFGQVYGATPDYGQMSIQPHALAGPSAYAAGEPTSEHFQIVHAKDYMSVKVIRVLVERGVCRTSVKVETGEELHFPWDYWQEARITRGDNSQKDGYIAAGKYRTWSLEPEAKDKGKKRA